MKMNLDHLRNAGRDNKVNNSMAINVTQGQNEYGQAYTYGSESAANAKNNVSEQEFFNGTPDV